MNSTNAQIKKLGKNNYETWRIQVKALVMKMDSAYWQHGKIYIPKAISLTGFITNKNN